MTKEIIRFNWNGPSLLPYEPDILASQQYLKNYRATNPVEPEKALLFAVLVDAVKTYQGFAFSKSPRKQRAFRDAKAWLWGEEPGCLFSFRGICEVFGIDPTFLRRGLIQWTADHKRSTSRYKRTELRLRVSRTRKHVITPPYNSSTRHFDQYA